MHSLTALLAITGDWGETPTKRFQELAGRAENGNRAFVYTNALLRQFVHYG